MSMTRVFCRCQSNEPQTTVPYTRRWKSGSVRVSSRVPDTERCTRARSSNCHSERGIRSIAQRISLAPDPSDSPLFALCDDLRRRGPPGRPEYKWTQVDWARLKKAVGQVYAYRSAVLNAGEPLPSPLLKVPWQGDMAHASERPLGMGTAHGSTTWAAKDLPMHLH